MRLKDTKEVKAMIDRMNAQGGGTEVIANPELVGDEAALTGLEVAGTKYKVDGGSGSANSFHLHTPITLPDQENTAPIVDQQDIEMLEGFYTSVLSGNFTMPCFYTEPYFETYEVDSDTYTYSQNETFVTNLMIDTYFEDAVGTINCTHSFCNYDLPPSPFAISSFGVTTVIFIRDGSGNWTYSRGAASNN